MLQHFQCSYFFNSHGSKYLHLHNMYIIVHIKSSRLVPKWIKTVTVVLMVLIHFKTIVRQCIPNSKNSSSWVDDVNSFSSNLSWGPRGDIFLPVSFLKIPSWQRFFPSSLQPPHFSFTGCVFLFTLLSKKMKGCGKTAIITAGSLPLSTAFSCKTKPISVSLSLLRLPHCVLPIAFPLWKWEVRQVAGRGGQSWKVPSLFSFPQFIELWKNRPISCQCPHWSDPRNRAILIQSNVWIVSWILPSNLRAYG